MMFSKKSKFLANTGSLRSSFESNGNNGAGNNEHGALSVPSTPVNGRTSTSGSINSGNHSHGSSAAWWFVCDFSTEELFILRSSFGAVKHRLENVAVAAFTSLFDERPDAFAVFIGKKVLPETRQDVAYSWETKQHGLRVLSVVERCLNRIDKWELFEDAVSGLALRHLQYGAKPVYILSLFGCLRQALLNEMEQASASTDEDGLAKSLAPNPQTDNPDCKVDLGAAAINASWNKFFRTLGLALISEMLTLQDPPPVPSPLPPTPDSTTIAASGKKKRTESSSFIKAVASKLSLG